MKIVKNEEHAGEIVRHIELQIPKAKAQELAETIHHNIDWWSTTVGSELSTLYNALLGQEV